jgi:ferredoxin--NADP+ reductase
VQQTLPVSLVFRSVGYHGVPIPGLPFDAVKGIVPNMSGRVVESPDSATPIRGVYVAGWIKRGPSGVIGTNKACAAETVDLVLADAAAGRLTRSCEEPDQLTDRLLASGALVTSWNDWQALDRIEQDRGRPHGQPRRKVTSVAEMLALIAAARAARPEA